MRNTLNSILAAFTFFTKLPVWKIANIPAESYSNIIQYWPLTGIVTGGTMALTYWVLVAHLPKLLAIILAIMARTLLTGALHEDGLADFFDGFGGGKSKEDILRIMKDSHTGSFALVGMIFYYFLLVGAMVNIESSKLLTLIIFADVFSKSSAMSVVNFLPYARNIAESKTKMLYEKSSFLKIGIYLSVCLLYLYMSIGEINILSLIMTFILVTIMFVFSKYKIGGYTGDVCGALVLLIEVSIYLSYTIH